MHRGLPSPYLTLIFSLADPVVCGRTLAQARSADAFRHLVLLGGLHHAPAFVVPSGQEFGVQLAVHPLAARRLFGVPPRALDAMAEAGQDVLGSGAEVLRLQLGEAATWSERFGLLTRYLRERVDRQSCAERVRPELAEAWRWLAWHRGTGSMGGLSAHVGLSGRQLRTLFHRELGVGPKQVSRLMRFEHAKQRIASAVASGDPPDLAGVAARCGFYDQAHLDRDFVQFAGIAPSGWIEEERRNIQAGGHRNGAEWSS